MAQSSIANVEDYLKDLPEDRREIISTIRNKILKNLKSVFEKYNIP